MSDPAVARVVFGASRAEGRGAGVAATAATGAGSSFFTRGAGAVLAAGGALATGLGAGLAGALATVLGAGFFAVGVGLTAGLAFRGDFFTATAGFFAATFLGVGFLAMS